MPSPPPNPPTASQTSSTCITTTSSKQPTLLTIPPQLRLQIYYHLFAAGSLAKTPSYMHFAGFVPPHILATSKLVRIEAKPLYLQALRAERCLMTAELEQLRAEAVRVPVLSDDASYLEELKRMQGRPGRQRKVALEEYKARRFTRMLSKVDNEWL
ncbi:hypothetical protein LTR36_005165 [Oleoguttula mirabilis]|uniref:Uncharacterized protein n=1 Tax=Oleoguttula mirabilis TaxID=1507867 RepID=A0AAV9JVV8_9PEZI|nr:hypothetical protein LTR36_005165 [Oleoguttula mirabilis]